MLVTRVLRVILFYIEIHTNCYLPDFLYFSFLVSNYLVVSILLAVFFNQTDH